MKKSLILIFLVIGLTLHFTSCRKEINSSTMNQSEAALTTTTVKVPDAEVNEDAFNTFYGPVVQMGDGHARSWINVTHDNKALALGVEITDEALQNLPDIPEAERDFISGPADFLLPLHQKAKELTPYDHICINWNAHGHEPAGLYDIPHFDFHFYRISLAEQMAIPPYNVAPALFDNDPPAGYIPPLYFHGPGGVPQMGAHWVDILSPEFNGEPFTHTFLYGTYNGKVTFHEPMITMNIIQTGATIHKDIRQPLYFSPTNKYYPTQYSIWKDDSNNKHYVSLDEMILR
jgi:hypothetical protein